MVAVVQLVERQVVILEVAGSSPVSHPRKVGGHFAIRPFCIPGLLDQVEGLGIAEAAIVHAASTTPTAWSDQVQTSSALEWPRRRPISPPTS
jgi:hypothetical protein